MWLFDWKADSQTLFGSFGAEGKALARIQGNIPPTSNANYFFSHNSDPIFREDTTEKLKLLWIGRRSYCDAMH